MPAENKRVPFSQYTGIGNAAELLDWVKQRSDHNLSKIKVKDLRIANDKGEKKDLGQREIDNLEFFKAMREEGVIKYWESSAEK